jgi:quercetin dioxygenase-like cupin family protein
MKQRWLAFAAAASLAACVSIDVQESALDDATVAALEGARVRECPADRTQAGARSEGFGAASGVQSVDVVLTPLAHDPARGLRLRRLTVQPGGVIAWHDHTSVQGYAVIVSGEMVELRNTCLDPLTYRAGDIAREDANTAHSWRNEGDGPAVIWVSHVVTR